MAIDPASVEALYQELFESAEAGGYHLNPDKEWTVGLLQGLLVNQERYGYRACPCRLASGKADEDLDLVCPCDYRDPDLNDFGACYCGLYVSDEVLNGEAEFTPVPERRPTGGPKMQPAPVATGGIRLWRCRVCGYLCARENPPGVCPVCKAKKERFEPFILPAGAVAAE
jgi:ferredoxin-thioredoxin reductase catalytic chain